MSGEGGESVPERKINTVVAYAPIKDADITVPLYPSVRYDEVKECKNDKVKLEKYLVWKLLEKIVESTLNIDFANVQFTKTDNGKWVCPDFYFSLSHTDGLVCVALSGSPIGVDTELVRDVNAGLAKKILTEREVDLMADLPFDEQNRYLLESWVRKESIFKKTGGEKLLPNRTETAAHFTELTSIEISGREYVISVSVDNCEKIEFKYMEEI